MKTFKSFLLPAFLLSCLALSGCLFFGSSKPDQEPSSDPKGGEATPALLTVTGTVTYLQRIAMLPNADVEVFLWDALGNPTSSAPVIVASTRIERPGTVPVTFSMTLDPALHNPRHDYYLTGRIVIGDTVLFETDTHYPALVKGQTNAIPMILVRASDALPDDASTRLPSLR